MDTQRKTTFLLTMTLAKILKIEAYHVLGQLNKTMFQGLLTYMPVLDELVQDILMLSPQARFFSKF